MCHIPLHCIKMRTQLTESEITKLLPTLRILALLHRRLATAHHHRTNAHPHHMPKLWAVDWHDLARVLAVNTKRRVDDWRLKNCEQISTFSSQERRTYVNHVIFPRNMCHLPNSALPGRVESTVLLWGQAEDHQCSIGIALCLILLPVPKKASESKLMAFDVKLLGLVDGGE
jgi:hypothetical protein